MTAEPAEITVNAMTVPWGWSLRWEQKMNFCPRGMFYHYYGAFGGADPAAEKRRRKLHLLKSLKSVGTFVRDLLAGELRELYYRESGEMFAAGRSRHREFLTANVRRKMRLQLSNMVRGESLTDHRIPMLAELYYREATPQKLVDDSEELCRMALDGFLATDLPDIFWGVPPLRRMNLPEVIALELPVARIYGAPVLCARADGEVCFLELTRQEPDKDKMVFAALYQNYLATQTIVAKPLAATGYFFGCADGSRVRGTAGPGEFSVMLDRIIDGKRRMLEMLRAGGMLCENDFARRADGCENCNFREECR